MRLAPSAFKGLVIGALLLASAGPAAAGSLVAPLAPEHRDHDAAHWALQTILPVLELIAGKLTYPIGEPSSMKAPPAMEANTA